MLSLNILASLAAAKVAVPMASVALFDTPYLIAAAEILVTSIMLYDIGAESDDSYSLPADSDAAALSDASEDETLALAGWLLALRSFPLLIKVRPPSITKSGTVKRSEGV